jgi:ATP-dependent protease ClpP protease subunit
MMQARRAGCPAPHRCQEHTEDSILAAHCNQPYEKVERDTHRDYFMTAEGAREYAIVDHVLTNRRAPNPP